MKEIKENIIFRPFGPIITKVIIPSEILNKLNKYADVIIEDQSKSKKLNHGNKLAGNVKQEFRLEQNFMESSGWGNFLGQNAANWIYRSVQKKITKFEIINSWIVSQFENEYNPIHTHKGHISGVGYLKIPNDFGKTIQSDKKNKNGKLELIHGSRMFLSESTFEIIPKVGDFYFFPNYLMHTVYPFINNNEERRSISFNAYIDEITYSGFE